MKLIFLIAFGYLLIEFLNRKPKEAADTTGLKKAVNKAADTLHEVVEETKEALSTPAKKSVVNVQSLDTVLSGTSVEKSVVKEPIEGKEVTQEALYASRHKATPDYEKAAERIVTRHEKIAREAMNTEESAEDEEKTY